MVHPTETLGARRSIILHAIPLYMYYMHACTVLYVGIYASTEKCHPKPAIAPSTDKTSERQGHEKGLKHLRTTYVLIAWSKVPCLSTDL
jgi:hypothetical protein